MCCYQNFVEFELIVYTGRYGNYLTRVIEDVRGGGDASRKIQNAERRNSELGINEVQLVKVRS